ncbi:MAG TPA: hypothetical protein VI168_05235 [Croceibacterium sp.]
MIKKALASLVATALVGTPVIAQAAAARTSSPVADAEELRGGFIIPAIAIIAVLLGILAATNGGNDDLPHSP